MPEEISEKRLNQHVLSQLEGLSDQGVIDYFIPTNPLGERWVVCHKNELLTFKSIDEITSFLLGIKVITDFMNERKRTGIL